MTDKYLEDCASWQGLCKDWANLNSDLEKLRKDQAKLTYTWGYEMSIEEDRIAYEEAKIEGFKNEVFEFTNELYENLEKITKGITSEEIENRMKGTFLLGVISTETYHFMDKHFPEFHALDNGE